MATYVICLNNFVGSRLASVNFVSISFSIQKGRFPLFNQLLNAGGPLEICGILRASKLNCVVLKKLVIFSVSHIRGLDLIDDLLDVC